MKTALWALLALSATAQAAGLEPSSVLPDPPSASRGKVPLEEPVAPVPAGVPAWSLAVSLNAGLADAFYSKVATTASLRHGFGAFAVEAFGGPTLSWADAAFDLCSAPGNCTTASTAQLKAAPGQMSWLGGVGGVVRGTGGKLSVGGLAPVRFSFEGGLGATAVGYRWTDASDHQEVGPGVRWALATGASLGSGFEARLELSGILYRTDIRGSQGWERQLFAGGGLAWVPGAR